MSILGDKRLVPKKSADLYTIYNIQYIDATTDHITPCLRMRARGSDHATDPENEELQKVEESAD